MGTDGKKQPWLPIHRGRYDGEQGVRFMSLKEATQQRREKRRDSNSAGHSRPNTSLQSTVARSVAPPPNSHSRSGLQYQRLSSTSLGEVSAYQRPVHPAVSRGLAARSSSYLMNGQLLRRPHSQHSMRPTTASVGAEPAGTVSSVPMDAGVHVMQRAAMLRGQSASPTATWPPGAAYETAYSVHSVSTGVPGVELAAALEQLRSIDNMRRPQVEQGKPIASRPMSRSSQPRETSASVTPKSVTSAAQPSVMLGLQVTPTVLASADVHRTGMWDPALQNDSKRTGGNQLLNRRWWGIYSHGRRRREAWDEHKVMVQSGLHPQRRSPGGEDSSVRMQEDLRKMRLGPLEKKVAPDHQSRDSSKKGTAVYRGKLKIGAAAHHDQRDHGHNVSLQMSVSTSKPALDQDAKGEEWAPWRMAWHETAGTSTNP